ncbi:MAG: DJ-1/PfpI family protein [Collinsella intestinalis]
MSGVAVLAADGFETIECLTVVDVLRRGGIHTALVSIMDTRDVVTSQQIPVTCDVTFDEVDFSEYDYVVLPGGLPGATNLRADERVCELVREFAATKHVAAICAEPFILAELGVLEGHKATCFPGFEAAFPRAPSRGPHRGGRRQRDHRLRHGPGAALRPRHPERHRRRGRRPEGEGRYPAVILASNRLAASS